MVLPVAVVDLRVITLLSLLQRQRTVSLPAAAAYLPLFLQLEESLGKTSMQVELHKRLDNSHNLSSCSTALSLTRRLLG